MGKVTEINLNFDEFFGGIQSAFLFRELGDYQASRRLGSALAVCLGKVFEYAISRQQTADLQEILKHHSCMIAVNWIVFAALVFKHVWRIRLHIISLCIYFFVT